MKQKLTILKKQIPFSLSSFYHFTPETLFVISFNAILEKVGEDIDGNKPEQPINGASKVNDGAKYVEKTFKRLLFFDFDPK